MELRALVLTNRYLGPGCHAYLDFLYLIVIISADFQLFTKPPGFPDMAMIVYFAVNDLFFESSLFSSNEAILFTGNSTGFGFVYEGPFTMSCCVVFLGKRRDTWR